MPFLIELLADRLRDHLADRLIDRLMDRKADRLADHLPNHWKRDCVNLTFIPVHPGGDVVIRLPRVTVLTMKRKRLANTPSFAQRSNMPV